MTITQDAQHVPHYGVFEFSLEADAQDQHPIFETELTVVFTRPDGSTITAEGFLDSGRTYKAAPMPMHSANGSGAHSLICWI